MSNIIYISPGVSNDAGGVEIVRGSDGRPHLVVVPPWDGETTAAALSAAAGLLTLASVTDKPGLRSTLENTAQAITESYAAEISNWADTAPTRSVGGAAFGA